MAKELEIVRPKLKQGITRKGKASMIDATHLLTAIALRTTNYVANPKEFAGDVVAQTGKIVQAAMHGQMAETINADIQKLKAEGNLLEARLSGFEAMTELLDYIQSTKIDDPKRFKAVRALFSVSLKASTSEQEASLAKEFIHIAKKLDGVDFLALRACYSLRQKGFVCSPIRGAWANSIAPEWGHGLRSMVLKCEDHLVGVHLWSEREEDQRIQPENSRLTDMGVKFCEFLKKGEATLS